MLKVFKPHKPKRLRYKNVLGFDIETAGATNEFVLACFYSSTFQKVCRSKQEVIHFMNSRAIRSFDIYATNLAFDFLGTFMEFSDHWRIIERKGTIYSFTWYQNVNMQSAQTHKNPIYFYDTIRLFPASVEKLGQLTQIPKLPHPSCFQQVPNTEQEWTELIEYCMNDARISYTFITDIYYPYLQKHELKPKSTIGSIALQDFKNNFLKKPLFPETEQARQFAFKGYYGGRTETFKRGTFKNVYCFDINSLYPSVMAHNLYPDVNRSRIYEKGSLYHINTYEGVSQVTVEVPYMEYPPLPYRTDGKLLFPVGIFTAYYCHNELRNAMKYGVKIIDVGESIVYPKTIDYFSEFVATHYAGRLQYQKENNPLEVMEKLVLNNLYGKFAFNYMETSSLIPAHQFEFDKHVKNATFLTPLFHNQFISISETDIKPPTYSFPILSAYITAYARIKLYSYIQDKRLSKKLIACDTDSLFLMNYENEIQTSDKLGDMKLEKGYPIASAVFVRPKMYKTAKPKCKGVVFSKDPDEAIQQFDDLLYTVPIEQQRFVKYRTAIRSQSHHQNGVLKVNQVIQITKQLDVEDTKRSWSSEFSVDDQQISEPININEYIPEKEKLKIKRFEDEYLEEKMTERMNEDTLDAKGYDITDAEFFKNEHIDQL